MAICSRTRARADVRLVEDVQRAGLLSLQTRFLDIFGHQVEEETSKVPLAATEVHHIRSVLCEMIWGNWADRWAIQLGVL